MKCRDCVDAFDFGLYAANTVSNRLEGNGRENSVNNVMQDLAKPSRGLDMIPRYMYDSIQ